MEDSNFILDDRLDWTNVNGQSFGDGELKRSFGQRAFRLLRGRDPGPCKGRRREVLSGNVCAFGARKTAVSESVIRCDDVGLKRREDKECLEYNKSEGGWSCPVTVPPRCEEVEFADLTLRHSPGPGIDISCPSNTRRPTTTFSPTMSPLAPECARDEHDHEYLQELQDSIPSAKPHFQPTATRGYDVL
jgi:hypothetical protein